MSKPKVQPTATNPFPEPKFKLVVLGPATAGKTCLIQRFYVDSFTEEYKPTIGIDFFVHRPKINGQEVQLQIWDAAGQPRFANLIPSYITGCHAAFVVFDVTSSAPYTYRATFEKLETWVDKIRDLRGDETLVSIVGNKIDLPHDERQVDTEEIKLKAEKLGVSYHEVSAKTGANIKAPFMEVTERLLEHPPDPTSVKLSDQSMIKLSKSEPALGSCQKTCEKCVIS